ncbi:MAG TPA: hypothetical protein VEX86_22010 [Longimicrobium sp.]|nr:hypothetical protein [Longimicrobium sp.]
MLDDHLDGAAHLRQLRRVEIRFGVFGGVAGGQEQRVALAQRHLQRPGEPRNHVAARLRLPRLHVAEVPH